MLHSQMGNNIWPFALNINGSEHTIASEPLTPGQRFKRLNQPQAGRDEV